MGRKYRTAEAITLIILLLFATAITGCSKPLINNNTSGNSTAVQIALSYPDIASEVNNSKGDYEAIASPSDPAVQGYLNYSGNFYDVTVNTANLGVGGIANGYMGQHKALVDIDSRRVMEIHYTFDVAYMPEHILVPGHATWYQKLDLPRGYTSDMPSSYIEMKLDQLNNTIRPLIVDDVNFGLLKSVMPYQAFHLSNIGENATQLNFDRHNPPVSTCLENVTAVPGRLPFPGNNINGSGLSLTYNEPGYPYYLILINDGSEDTTVDVMVM